MTQSDAAALMEVRPGEYRLIRADGAQQLISERPFIGRVTQQIGCETIDTVTLDRKRRIVMMVDDTGMVDNKPVNPKASALMQFVRPGYPYNIHGDVAIVNDHDFE